MMHLARRTGKQVPAHVYLCRRYYSTPIAVQQKPNKPPHALDSFDSSEQMLRPATSLLREGKTISKFYNKHFNKSRFKDGYEIEFNHKNNNRFVPGDGVPTGNDMKFFYSSTIMRGGSGKTKQQEGANVVEEAGRTNEVKKLDKAMYETGTAAQVDEIFELASKAGVVDNKLISTYIYNLARRASHEKAIQKYESVKDKADTDIHVSGIAAYAKAMNGTKALDIYKSLVSKLGLKELPSRATASLMNYYFDFGELRKGVEVFDNFQQAGGKVDVKILTSLMRGYRLVGNFKKVEEIFDSISTKYELVPEGETHGELVMSYARSFKTHIPTMMTKLQQMKSLGHRPSHTVYSTIVGAMIRNGEYGNAMMALDMQSKEGIAPLHKGYVVTVARHFAWRERAERVKPKTEYIAAVAKEAGLGNDLAYLSSQTHAFMDDYFFRHHPAYDYPDVRRKSYQHKDFDEFQIYYPEEDRNPHAAKLRDYKGAPDRTFHDELPTFEKYYSISDVDFSTIPEQKEAEHYSAEKLLLRYDTMVDRLRPARDAQERKEKKDSMRKLVRHQIEKDLGIPKELREAFAVAEKKRHKANNKADAEYEEKEIADAKAEMAEVAAEAKAKDLMDLVTLVESEGGNEANKAAKEPEKHSEDLTEFYKRLDELKARVPKQYIEVLEEEAREEYAEYLEARVESEEKAKAAERRAEERKEQWRNRRIESITKKLERLKSKIVDQEDVVADMVRNAEIMALPEEDSEDNEHGQLDQEEQDQRDAAHMDELERLEKMGGFNPNVISLNPSDPVDSPEEMLKHAKSKLAFLQKSCKIYMNELSALTSSEAEQKLQANQEASEEEEELQVLLGKETEEDDLFAEEPEELSLQRILMNKLEELTDDDYDFPVGKTYKLIGGFDKRPDDSVLPEDKRMPEHVRAQLVQHARADRLIELVTMPYAIPPTLEWRVLEELDAKRLKEVQRAAQRALEDVVEQYEGDVRSPAERLIKTEAMKIYLSQIRAELKRKEQGAPVLNPLDLEERRYADFNGDGVAADADMTDEVTTGIPYGAHVLRVPDTSTYEREHEDAHRKADRAWALKIEKERAKKDKEDEALWQEVYAEEKIKMEQEKIARAQAEKEAKEREELETKEKEEGKEKKLDEATSAFLASEDAATEKQAKKAVQADK